MTTGIAGVEFPDAFEQVDSVHAGKPDVAEHDVGPKRLEHPKGLLRVTRHLRLVARLGKKCLHGARERAFIVDDENG